MLIDGRISTSRSDQQERLKSAVVHTRLVIFTRRANAESAPRIQVETLLLDCH
jgi:hypothetical protein